MSTQLIVAIISAVVALVAAAITVWGQTRNARLEHQLRRKEEAEKRKLDAERIFSRYREPLVHAAYDLQSRIFNLLELQIISVHYDRGDQRARDYVIINTAYLIAQYFGWTEVIRQEGLFLDLGEDEKTRKMNLLQDEITNAWLRDDLGKSLMIFRGNQRVIGEQMIKKSGEMLNCLTYGEFLLQLGDTENDYLDHLTKDVRDAILEIDNSRPRLVLLQQALINLVDFLDPKYLRFPANRRTKLQR